MYYALVEVNDHPFNFFFRAPKGFAAMAECFIVQNK